MSIAQNLLRLRRAPKFINRLLFKRVILVFQMGKVGSASAFDAILRSLEKQDSRKGEEDVREIGRTILIHGHEVFGFREFRSIILRRARLGLPIKIVCPIREPISRNVSAFFPNYVKQHPDLLANADLRELKELFLLDTKQNYFGPAPAKQKWPLNWFDEHFKPLTRIDVYRRPFPIDRKWQTYRRGFTRVLVYRNDLKRSEQAKLISRFLGIKLDEMRPIHAADRNKDYAERYSQFRESVKLPEQYIRRMHDSRYAQHFWSPEELKAAADKWRAASGN